MCATRNIGSYETFNFEGSEISADIGAYAVVNCQQPVTISGNIGAYATINCGEGAVFTGNVGNYAEINCSGTPTFTRNVGAYVSIHCRGTPVFKGDVGSYVEVNGSDYSSSTSTRTRDTVVTPTNEKKYNVVGVGGSLVVGKGAISVVSVTGMDYSSLFSSASIFRSMPSTSSTFTGNNERKDVPVAPESKLKAYSKTTQAYIDSFERKPKNVDILRGLKLTPQEENEFADCCDLITTEVANIPVRLNGRLFDLQTLIKLPETTAGLRVDPFNRDEFYIRDVQPARDIQEKIDKTIRLIQVERAAAAHTVDAGLPKQSPPGGPTF